MFTLDNQTLLSCAILRNIFENSERLMTSTPHSKHVFFIYKKKKAQDSQLPEIAHLKLYLASSTPCTSSV